MTTMRTFKFLARGAVGPFSGRAWPALGDWIVTEGTPILGSRGVHVCRPGDLAFWLQEELWEVEVGGATLAAEDCLVAERARLTRRIEAWNADGMRRFADACIASAEATKSPFVGDAKLSAQHGYFAVAAFCAAMATGELRRERIWQSAWLEREFLNTA